MQCTTWITREREREKNVGLLKVLGGNTYHHDDTGICICAWCEFIPMEYSGGWKSLMFDVKMFQMNVSINKICILNSVK